MVKILLKKDVKWTIEQLCARGYEAYAVGGCVRDLLLGKQPQDWDITTSALPQQVRACFPGHVLLDTGLAHGTLTLVLRGVPYEITTFRREGAYEDGRRPSQVFFDAGLAQDLARRDFTINALAYNDREGLVDCFGGQVDLQARLVRCVGQADARFAEDGLRILRGLRFAAQLGFSLEEKTGASIIQNRMLLKRIAAERVQKELSGLLCGTQPGPVLDRFAQVLSAVLPEIEPMVGFAQCNPYHDKDVWQHTVQAVQYAKPKLEVRLALLFHDMGKPHCFTCTQGQGHFYGHAAHSETIAKTRLAALRYSRAITEKVLLLVRMHDRPLQKTEKSIRRLLGKIGQENFEDLLEVQRGDVWGQSPLYREERLAHLCEIQTLYQKILQEGQCFSLRDLSVSGGDLLALGLPQGKAVGQGLQALLQQVVDGNLPNEKEALLQWFGSRAEDGEREIK